MGALRRSRDGHCALSVRIRDRGPASQRADPRKQLVGSERDKLCDQSSAFSPMFDLSQMPVHNVVVCRVSYNAIHPIE